MLTFTLKRLRRSQSHTARSYRIKSIDLQSVHGSNFLPQSKTTFKLKALFLETICYILSPNCRCECETLDKPDH